VRTNFFGWSETGRKSILEFFVNSLRAGTPVRGYPDFIVTSVYVQSLLKAIWRLGELGATGTLNIASSDALSKYDFGLTVAKAFGLDSGLIAPMGSATDGHATSRNRDLSLNTERAASLLGAPMQSQADGVREARDEEQILVPRLRG
jgi:dTDP-4-dehydrorhamnose reductase